MKPRATFYNSIYDDPSELGEVVGSREVVYLSPDADDEILEFDPETVYIIGGLVDGTINSMQTRNKAKSLNIKSARLPLDEFRKKYSSFRPCLNITTVFEIIDKFYSYRDISRAIDESIPLRFKTGKTKYSNQKKRQQISDS